MLKFKKNGIFSRSASEEATASELQEGGVVAVWGSPGSGKTTMAVKIAKYLADKKRNVVLLLCDMTAPMLPCICPASELECERSLGSVLAAAHVTENLVKNNLITHKRLGYLTILGMLKGENEYTYVDSALYLSQMDEIDRKLRELRKLRRRLLEAAGEDRQIHDTERMMEYLEDGPEWLDEVPAELFGELIERIIIIGPERLKFRLLNGMELAENIERTVR